MHDHTHQACTSRRNTGLSQTQRKEAHAKHKDLEAIELRVPGGGGQTGAPENTQDSARHRGRRHMLSTKRQSSLEFQEANRIWLVRGRNH